MKLQDILKTSLDELRMQMLGVQVLFGFQFQGLFQDRFDGLNPSGRIVDATGLVLMIASLGMCIAVPCQHRFVENGADTLRMYRTAQRYANRALLPLAGGIGCDLYVAVGRPFGPRLATAFAIVAFLTACAAWFIAGLVLRGLRAANAEAPMERANTPLHAKIEQMLTEARVVLPGAQALLGFQLMVMMTKAFDEMPRTVRDVHLIALSSLTLTIILLISPAAIHRLGFGGQDNQRFHAIGSGLIAMALAPLALSISCDLYVAFFRLFRADSVALPAAAGALALLSTLWYVLPFALRQTSGRVQADA